MRPLTSPRRQGALEFVGVAHATVSVQQLRQIVTDTVESVAHQPPQALEVLVEDERVIDGVPVCSGQTDDYVRVWFEGGGLLGEIAQVEGARLRADGIEGRLVASPRRELISSRQG